MIHNYKYFCELALLDFLDQRQSFFKSESDYVGNKVKTTILQAPIYVRFAVGIFMFWFSFVKLQYFFQINNKKKKRKLFSRLKNSRVSLLRQTSHMLQSLTVAYYMEVKSILGHDK